jgi:hypothetical protein
MENEDGLKMLDFAIYSSPRYYRLIFSELKPAAKNGDLLSALGELKNAKILSETSDWDRIKLTKKGVEYKKLIQKLLDYEALHSPQTTGLFDYRSEQGRIAIIDLIRFIDTKLDFNGYFQYLDLPVFKSERDSKWMEIVADLKKEKEKEKGKLLKETDKEKQTEFDKESEKESKSEKEVVSEKYSNDESQDNENKDTFEFDLFEEGMREKISDLMKKKKLKTQRDGQSIYKKITEETNTIIFNTTLIKKYLKQTGFKRPEPLFNHFNSGDPIVFTVRERTFTINFPEFMKIKRALEEHLVDYHQDENKWLSEYFNLLKVPNSGLFGVNIKDVVNFSTEQDAFLKLAVEGPIVFAGQFSAIQKLGSLKMIMIPINKKEALLIYTPKEDMIYYFTLPLEQCEFSLVSKVIVDENFPEIYLASKRRFGRLYSYSYTFRSSFNIAEKDIATDKAEKKLLETEQKNLDEELIQTLNDLSRYSISFYIIAQTIAKKFTPKINLSKALAIYTNGLVSFHYLSSELLLTQIQFGIIDTGSEIKRIMKNIEDSMSEILDMAGEDTEDGL